MKEFCCLLKKLKNINSFDNFIKFVVIIFQEKKFRFLLVGLYNSCFSYIFGLIYFYFVNINFIKLTIFNILIIIHSFVTHKYLSFKKPKYSKSEILRGIVSYGSMYLISYVIIFGLIKIGFSQVLAYNINFIISIILFYIIHSKFTFK